MAEKINVIHFHNGKTGGVWSVISNLLQYRSDPRIHYQLIFCIEKNQTVEIKPEDLPEDVRCDFFHYSSSDNFYYTCRRLSKLIPDQFTVLIAHDWLELGMASHLGLPNPLIYYAHGDYEYYYGLGRKHKDVIDSCVTVSESLAANMKAGVPQLKAKTCCIYFPVPEAFPVTEKIKGSLVFVGRLSETKGYDILIRLAKKLSDIKSLSWHIVGEGDNTYVAANKWPEDVQVLQYGQISNSRVRELLSKMEILVLPSMREGMPNVVIEAMKAGAVPIVSDIEGGVQELIEDGTTGFLVSREDVDHFAKLIIRLQSGEERNLTGRNAKAKADSLFDPKKNAALFEKHLMSISKIKPSPKPKIKVYGSRMDEQWIPNSVTRMLRKLGKISSQ